MSILEGGVGLGRADIADFAQPQPCAPMTIDNRIKDLEMRANAMTEKLAIAETVYTRLIAEVNNLRNQLGIPELDRNYFLP